MNRPSLPVKILIGIVVCLGIGFASGLSSTDAITTWYAGLNKPVFSPPNWLFGPAWTLLYTLIGIAAALIWHEGLSRKAVRTALIIFGIQLLLNAAWTPMFFGLQNPLLGLIVISILLVMIVVTILHFRRLKTLAAWLMVPYILWVSFATLLNASILYLN